MYSPWLLGQIGTILNGVLPTNFCNAQKHQQKVNGAKDFVLFHQHFCWNLSAYFMIQLLCWVPCFGALLPNAVAVKSIRNYMRKSWSALAPKMLVVLTQGKSKSCHFQWYFQWWQCQCKHCFNLNHYSTSHYMAVLALLINKNKQWQQYDTGTVTSIAKI